jgi:hypothetical protein
VKLTHRFAGLVAVIAVLSMVNPLAAEAGETPTSIAFAKTAPLSVAFGSPWVIALTVSATGPYGVPALDESSGTVDVFIEGIPGAYASKVPVQAGGVVFFSQPLKQPLLGAGTYSVSAIFTPSGGSGLGTSQTAAPTTLIITPLAVAAKVSVAASSSEPVITAELTGEYRDTTGTVPPGVWTFKVTKADSTESVFDRTVLQQSAPDKILVTIDSKLAAGSDFVVSSTFTPVSELAPGLTVTAPGDSTFRTPDATFLEILGSPVLLPVWAWILAAIVFLALTASLVVVIVRQRRKPTAPGGTQDSELEQVARTEPVTVVGGANEADGGAVAELFGADGLSEPNSDSAAAGASDPSK